jgi:hypothetical protein
VNSTVYFKWFSQFTLVNHLTVIIQVHFFNNMYNFTRHCVFRQCLPHDFPTGGIKGFLKSIKVSYRMLCHSALCYTIMQRSFIRSIQLWCFLGPACSFLKHNSTESFIQLRTIPCSTLLGTGSWIIPLQLLQFMYLNYQTFFPFCWQFFLCPYLL